MFNNEKEKELANKLQEEFKNDNLKITDIQRSIDNALISIIIRLGSNKNYYTLELYSENDMLSFKDLYLGFLDMDPEPAIIYNSEDFKLLTKLWNFINKNFKK